MQMLEYLFHTAALSQEGISNNMAALARTPAKYNAPVPLRSNSQSLHQCSLMARCTYQCCYHGRSNLHMDKSIVTEFRDTTHSVKSLPFVAKASNKVAQRPPSRCMHLLRNVSDHGLSRGSKLSLARSLCAPVVCQ